jgi:hypothetical protein
MVALDGVIELRQDTAANWESTNPVLLAGELGWDTTNHLIKVGDGATAWNSLKPGPGGVHAFIRVDGGASSRSLTSTTATQKLFDSPTNGALNLPVGSYRFNCCFYLGTMSSTTGNTGFDLKGAGTAVLGSILMFNTGSDNLQSTTVALSGRTMPQQNTSSASMVTAATATAMSTFVTGTFEVTTAGTIIPSVYLVTAAAAVVIAGSWFECWSVGATTTTTAGDWS